MSVPRFSLLTHRSVIAIGGDGTLSIALRLAAKGIPVVGVPKTIDNDILHTSVTFGFDTAVTIVVLILLGRLLEARARDRASRAMRVNSTASLRAFSASPAADAATQKSRAGPNASAMRRWSC